MFGPAYGSSHDSFVFSASGFPEWAERNLLHNGIQYTVVGDAAYPAREYLKKPFTGTLTAEERQYNILLIPQRVVVERTFGYFKCKFQKFRHENVNGCAHNFANIFYAATVLHNLSIDDSMNNGVYVEDDDEFVETIIREDREFNFE